VNKCEEEKTKYEEEKNMCNQNKTVPNQHSVMEADSLSPEFNTDSDI